MSACYAPVGPWWTLDAPSLRLPTRDGDRVSIWTVGDGPSLLLVPRPGEDARPAGWPTCWTAERS